MEIRGHTLDRHGRRWEARVLDQTENEAEDFRFWYENLTPTERVAAVADCLLSSLRARGIDEIPRLRRVHRVLERRRG